MVCSWSNKPPPNVLNTDSNVISDVSLADTLHGYFLWGTHSLSHLDFMVHLGSHAATDTTKHHVRYDIDNMSQSIVPFALGEPADASQATCQDLQAVGTTDQTNIVFIQTETISFSNHIRCRTDCRSRAKRGFQTHAGNWAAFLAHLTRLKATAATKISLATL
jgi:hypothetical protein